MVQPDAALVIYLDNHATTPCDPRVVDAMLPYFETHYANPGSQTHRSGAHAADAVRQALERVAALIGARPGEIVFTGSATESNNLALLGLALGTSTARRKLIATAIEHKSVLGPLTWLGCHGFLRIVAPVDRFGHVDAATLFEQFDDQTLLLSIQAANNEIGTLQRVAKIAERAHQFGILVHCDAVQAIGRTPIDVDELDVDLLSFSAHKIYGPKGVAALYIRGGRRALPFQPLMFGGDQEDGLRPGTLNVPGIVGFGKASELPHEAIRIGKLRDRLEAGLESEFPWISTHGDRSYRLPGNSSLTFPGLDAEAIIANLGGVAVSVGSACNSGALEPSYVLDAIGLSREEGYQSLRIGVGRFNTASDIEQASVVLHHAIRRLQGLISQ